MQKKRIVKKSHSSRTKKSNNDSCSRVDSLLEELINKNLENFDAIKYGAEWLSHRRFPTIRVVNPSESEMALTTDSGFEIYVEFNPEKLTVKMYFLTPDMIMTERDRCQERWKLAGLRAFSHLGTDTIERSLDRVLYWWFVMLSDYDKLGWPLEGLCTDDFSNRVA